MTSVKRIGILTGGGDCPGLNPAIRAATKKAVFSGMEVLGIRDGWRGLLSDDKSLQMPLDLDTVRHIDRLGGTILGTSRTSPYGVSGGVEAVQKNWKALGLDALVVIGGEGTLAVANKIYSDIALPLVGIPKTIDRDLPGTEYTLGFESALQVITDATDSLRSTAESHARVFVVEVMGRYAGHLALRGGISAGANIILIPECPFNVDKVCELLAERKARHIRYSIVFVAEGAFEEGKSEITLSGGTDSYGRERLGGIGDWLANEIQTRKGIESRAVNLSHLQRGGKPVAYDRRMGFYFGTAAAEAILRGKFGTLVTQKNGRVTLVPLKEASGSLSLVDVEHSYDTERYRAAQSALGDDFQ
jgi:phosphofructokinase-like protein